MGDKGTLLVLAGVLLLGALGLGQSVYAGVLIDTVTVDGVGTQGDCEDAVPSGLEGTFNGATNTCTLQNNLDVKIIVTVNDFTLDCNNKIIQSLVPGEGKGITVDTSSEVKIKNCTVNDFENNIVIQNSNKNEISDNTLNNAQTSGISLVNSDENMIFSNGGTNNDFLLDMLNSDDNLVESNSMNDGQNGMAMSGSSENTIRFNTIFQNSNSGFQILGGSNNIIFDNSIGSNVDYGLRIENTDENQITQNEITNNDNGLVLFDSGKNMIMNNTIQNNSGDGLILESSDENQIVGNLIDGNLANGDSGHLGYGIFSESSELNSIFQNNISNNEADGIFLFDSSNNNIFNNNFVNNPNHIIDDFGTNNQFNMELPVGGNYFDIFDEPGEGCNDANPSNGVCDDPFVFSGGQDNLPWTKPDGWLDAVSPEDKIEELIEEVDKLDLHNGNKNALTKKLENAINNITNDDPTDDAEACDKLQSFINQLNAKVNSSKLEASDVQQLIDTADSLINELC